MTFNGDNVQAAISQKHLGLALDSKLNFNRHISNKINKCTKIVVVKFLYFYHGKLYYQSINFVLDLT